MIRFFILAVLLLAGQPTLAQEKSCIDEETLRTRDKLATCLKERIDLRKEEIATLREDLEQRISGLRTELKLDTSNLRIDLGIITQRLDDIVKTLDIANAPDVFSQTVVEGIELVYLPAGCFQMGSENTSDDSRPVHKVCVDSFWMGKHEITQGQWEAIMVNNPSKFKQGDNYPVEMVSIDDAKNFIRKLSRKVGKRFRLPFEAEWEYACLAGDSTRYCGGDNGNALAWHSGNSTRQVGQKAPNDFGLYDMSGNVWEWCRDWYDPDYYSVSPENNPQGPDNGVGRGRIVRGGGWHEPASWRNYGAKGRQPTYTNTREPYLGFRIVLSGQ